MDNKSRMTGDCQVRFCERLALKCACLLDCGSNAIQKIIQIKQTTPLFEVSNFEAKFKIYPNPASNFVTINTESTPSVSSIEIRDILGRVCTKLSDIHTNIHEVSISTFPKGVYFVVVYDNDGQLLGSQKLVINR